MDGENQRAVDAHVLAASLSEYDRKRRRRIKVQWLAADVINRSKHKLAEVDDCLHILYCNGNEIDIGTGRQLMGCDHFFFLLFFVSFALSVCGTMLGGLQAGSAGHVRVRSDGHSSAHTARGQTKEDWQKRLGADGRWISLRKRKYLEMLTGLARIALGPLQLAFGTGARNLDRRGRCALAGRLAHGTETS